MKFRELRLRRDPELPGVRAEADHHELHRLRGVLRGRLTASRSYSETRLPSTNMVAANSPPALTQSAPAVGLIFVQFLPPPK